MLLSKEKIKEALEYYSIKDIDYYENCNRCIDETNNNKKIYDKTNEIYEILLGRNDKPWCGYILGAL